MSRVFVYDTTLRDGSQGEGVNFSAQDTLLLPRKLDELGVDFIEGGYPLSNPKDFEYFQAVRELPLKHAKVDWQNPEQLRFVLTEGKKRQIRRMCELVGLKVVGLKRVRIGRITLGNLPPGQWRYLGPQERF